MIVRVKKLTVDSLDDISELDGRFGSPWSSDLYKERIHLFSELSHGAYLDGKLVGFIVGKRLSPEEVLISRIVVKKEKENNGVGKKLVEHFEEFTDDIKVISAITRRSNKHAISLYKNCDFIQDKDYQYKYKDDELGLKFIKKVNL